jgi:hypothetical protein
MSIETPSPESDQVEWISAGMQAFCRLAELVEKVEEEIEFSSDSGALNLLLEVDGAYLDLFTKECYDWLRLDRAYWEHPISKEQAGRMVTELVDDFLTLRDKLCSYGIAPAKSKVKGA